MSDSAIPAARVRQTFLDFFAQNGHTVVRSSPLVPQDASLLFTNAGMVQFKDVFTGKQALGFRRAASSQKCVRAGGKHNDLDNVGRTARHHTFFEMLGNFSFGDYFKEEAITLAWRLLHDELGLPSERLMFTVFRGEGEVPADDEARRLWQRIAGVPEERVVGLGKKDNFWMMGETGPQGPCSEIHFHQGDDLPCDEVDAGRPCLGPACDCDRWLEIWNLVFMQFEKKDKDGPLLPLPAPSIDTGAGLERLTAVLQGRRSNYDTDLFQPLIQRVSQACGRAYTGRFDRGPGSEDDVAMRVLADHSRTTAFLIADGVLPSNLGRGYVMRNIMRRAVRYAMHLGLPAGFLAELCGEVVRLMGGVFPELHSAARLIDKAVNAEDTGSRETIERGLREIDKYKGWRGEGPGRVLPGDFAFYLHDTLGFKVDLQQVIGREQGFAVDLPGFEELMEGQRKRNEEFKHKVEVPADIYKAVREAVGPTRFTGYERGPAGSHGTGQVVALILPGGQRVDEISEGQEADVLVDQTPFYGRSGGQVGDTGRLGNDAGAAFLVEDTMKPLADLIVHHGRVDSGSLRVGQAVQLAVDDDRRGSTRKNHSATHLLHHALRQLLGEHVTQKGSYVGPDKLTFDFSHFNALTADERQRIERRVNDAILRNHDQDVRETSFDEARALGALALFGEKYGERVRVMRLGDSVELCGGTHVFRTGDIGLFKIVAESSVAKGVRRIEAVTGGAAHELSERTEGELLKVAELLRATPFEVSARVERLLDELKGRDREIAKLKEKLLTGAAAGGLYNEEREVAGIKVVVRRMESADQKALREAAEKLRDKLAAGVVVLGGVAEGKAQLVVAASKEVAADKGRSGFHANQIVGKLAPLIGGRGGGKPELAQAGGSGADKLDEALQQTFAVLGA